MRQKYEEAFEALGVPLPTELRRVSPAYRVFFGDGDSMELLYDVNEMSKQLETFRDKLEVFAAEHKQDIRKDPAFRKHFQVGAGMIS